MTRRLRGTLLAAAVPLFLISACARTAGNSAAASPEERVTENATAPPADALMLRVESYGGFVPADLNIGRIPELSVYADGRMITQGPVPLIYPGPALPNLQQQTITPELVRELTRQAVEAGVRDGADFGTPAVADAPYTRVTVSTGYGKQSVEVMALNETQADDPSLTAVQRAARVKLDTFVKKVRDLPHSAQPVAYDAPVLTALTRPYAEPQGDQPKSPPVAWPGPELPGEKLHPGVAPALDAGCVELTGAAKDTVLAAAKTANATTPWTQGGARWSIIFRPLLPDEQDCGALKGVK